MTYFKWEKKGLIFCPGTIEEVTHAAIPFAEVLNEKKIRVYYSSRNKEGKSLPFYIDIDADNPLKIIERNPEPILQLGKSGTFDDSGIMPSSVVNFKGEKWMYYIGWNPQVTVSYRLSIGLAISEDGGKSFKKVSEGPIMDRDRKEPYFVTAPFVMYDNERWKMWYISCTEWQIINGYPEPKYHIKYAESNNGIDWEKSGIICIDYTEEMQAIGRPSVFFDYGKYKMYFSFRKLDGYRTNKNNSYRIGYAESYDGKIWEVKNEVIDFSVSVNGWDSEMIEYSHYIQTKNRRFLFYNGNGFGKSGFGYAELT